MDELRTLIQTKLEEIEDLEVSAEVPDNMLEDGKTYFSYNLQKTYLNGDHDKNYAYQVNLTGFIKRLEKPEENTLKIIDNISDKIGSKLKELNIKCDFVDVSVLDGIRKTQVSGETIYNEINNALA